MSNSIWWKTKVFRSAFLKICPITPLFIVQLLAIPSEVTVDDIIFSYICVRRPNLTWQTLIRGGQEGFFQHTNSTFWSSAKPLITIPCIVSLVLLLVDRCPGVLYPYHWLRNTFRRSCPTPYTRIAYCLLGMQRSICYSGLFMVKCLFLKRGGAARKVNAKDSDIMKVDNEKL